MLYRFLSDGVWKFLSFFTWTNIKISYQTFRKMTYWQLFKALIKLNFKIAFTLLTFLFHVFW